MRSLSGSTNPVSALLLVNTADVRTADRGTVVVVNTTDQPQLFLPTDPLPPSAGAPFGNLQPLESADGPAQLGPGEVRTFTASRSKPISERTRRNGRALTEALKGPRVVIERLRPCVDDGAFPVKRIVGQSINVEADVFTDGHDVVAAELLWRGADERDWTRIPLTDAGNDRWTASFYAEPDRPASFHGHGVARRLRIARP